MAIVLKFYEDHTKPIGTATLDGDTFKVTAETPEGDDFIKSRLVHHHIRLLDQNGREPTKEEVAREVAAQMPDGKRTWCELIES